MIWLRAFTFTLAIYSISVFAQNAQDQNAQNAQDQDQEAQVQNTQDQNPQDAQNQGVTDNTDSSPVAKEKEKEKEQEKEKKGKKKNTEKNTEVSKQEAEQEAKQEPKEVSKQEAKQEPKEVSKQEAKQEPKEVSKQEPEQEPKQKSKQVSKKREPKKFEKVQVTGSRIRRTDFEGPTPIMVIDRKTLDDSSYNSVGDVLRDLPISNFGAYRETSGTTTSGSSTVNLRGQGSTNTLVMINGTRLQRNGRSGAADMNLIPEIAIESTDILLDGASAIYGADAIGGVLHLKTRKDFTGVEGSIKYVLPEDNVGNKLDIGVIGGKQYKNFSVTAAYQYRQNKELRGADRSWLRPKFGSEIAPTPSYFSNNGTPGVDKNGGDDHWAMRPQDITACNADPNSKYEKQRIKKEGVEGEIINDVCRYNWFNIATELPEINQHSAYTNFVWTPNSRTTLDTSVIFTMSTNDSRYAPVPHVIKVNPAAVAGWGVTLPKDLSETACEKNDRDEEGVCIKKIDQSSFRHRFIAAGNREFEYDSQAYNITSTLTHEFLETWEVNAILGFGQSENNSRTANGAMLIDKFKKIVNSGDYNPYSPNAAALKDAFYVPFQDTKAYDVFTEFGVNGELLELWNDDLPLSGAFGLQYGHSYYSDTSDPESAKKNVIGGASSGGSGDRDFVALYGEVLVPFTKKLEMQAAARVDWFDDFGLATSPMVAFKYSPTRSLALRASGGQAFKAPLLQDVYASGSSGYPFFIDQVLCERNGRKEKNIYCSPKQYLVAQEVGADLDPEEALNLNFGVIYAPTSNFSVTADFWRVDVSNKIGVSDEQITFTELRNPSTLAENGIKVERRSNGEIEKITRPLQNLSGSITDGLNLSLTYRMDTGIGAFVFSDMHSHIFRLESEPFKGVGFIDFSEDNPLWRNTASLTYMPTRSHAFTASYMMIPEYNVSNRFDKVPFHGELDINYTTKLAWNATVNVGFKNVLNTAPPVDDFVGFYGRLYNPLGRYAFLNYRQSF